jgi:hypothetical protein
MKTEMNTIRLLGAALLLVLVAALLSDFLRFSAVGSGSTSDILVNISENLSRGIGTSFSSHSQAAKFVKTQSSADGVI